MMQSFGVLVIVFGLVSSGAVGQVSDQNDDDGDADGGDGSSVPTSSHASDDAASQSAGGGTFNLNGLQGALQQGGVSALSNMLKAMSAGAGNKDAEYHIKTDTSGAQVYDFRDLSPPAPAAAVNPTSPPIERATVKPETPLPAKQLRGSEISSSISDLKENGVNSATRPVSESVDSLPDQEEPGGSATESMGGSADTSAVAKVMRDMQGIGGAGDDNQDLIANLKSLVGTEAVPKAPVVRVVPQDQGLITNLKSLAGAELVPKAPVVPAVPKTAGRKLLKHKHHHPRHRHPRAHSAEHRVKEPVMTTASSGGVADAHLPISDLSKGLLAVKHGVDALLSGANSMARSHEQGGDMSITQSQNLLHRVEALEDSNKQEKQFAAEQAGKITKLSIAILSDRAELKALLASENNSAEQDAEPSLQLEQVERHHHKSRHGRRHGHRHQSRRHLAKPSVEPNAGIRTFLHFKAKAIDS